jgi:ubiquinone/menaquinone biosynthesis C-methylase UbiE
LNRRAPLIASIPLGGSDRLPVFGSEKGYKHEPIGTAMSRQDIHTPEEWAEILKKQADYTKTYRHTLYEKVDIQTKKKILDVGCGTGAVTEDIASLTDGYITGIDIDDLKLEYAKSLISDRIHVMLADVLQLPFRDETFDLVVFSVVLTHIHQQQKAVNEMTRVTCKDGIVLATMEPDYAGILNYPESEADLILRESFEDIGVEMYTGRKLRYFFGKAGLKTEIGLFSDYSNILNEDGEKQVESFLKYFEKTEKRLVDYGWTSQQVEEYKQERLELIKNNLLFSFCPCFYAIGRK